MSQLVKPHASEVVCPLLAPLAERPERLKKAQGLKKVPMTSCEVSDVLMMAMGAYTPIEGFMAEGDWRASCLDMRLRSGIFWPIPITLSCDRELAAIIHIGEDIALIDTDTGSILAVMEVFDKYAPDKTIECEHIYRCTDERHPGVRKVMEQKPVNLGGRVTCLSEGSFPDQFGPLYIRPLESRAIFREQGWSTVAAFQTRNPMHRSHEYLAKLAIEVTDGVFIHQVLGKLKPGDIPARIRTRAIQVMIDNYFVPGTVLQAGYPIEMRYAGPREALLHALIRQNFGCSHLIVGRDHAGVGDFYGPYDSQDIFTALWPGALLTKPFKIGVTFYCEKCYGMATERTCPHDPRHRIQISGTKQREMLSRGEAIPPEFNRPEVVELLKKYYAGLH